MQYYFRAILALVLMVFFYQCQDEKIITDPSARLGFSTDTVRFDTIFSTVGSTTKAFKIYNNHHDNLNISSIYLGKGDASCYRINIDGIQANSFKNVLIRKKDSLYVFVEVTIDPGKNDMLEKDSLMLITNNNVQHVKLLAWGQDIHLIKENSIIKNDTTFTSQKPYLIYDCLTIDNGYTLTIEKGTKLYFHKDAEMIINGTISAEGTYEEPINFAGDRLEELYDDIPGQWGGILLSTGSRDNLFNYVEIKNGVIGIKIGDNNSHSENPKVAISNSKIGNMTFGGIIATHADIEAHNLLISNCGYYAIRMQGGKYNFYHTTIANYFNFSTRVQPSVLMENSITTPEGDFFYDLDCSFFNSIVYGTNNNEISFGNEDAGASISYLFDHCLLKVNLNDIDTSGMNHYKHNIYNVSPGFVSTIDHDFSLDSASIAINKGDVSVGETFPLDIEHNSRTDDDAPDLGAYEYGYE
jgi:hypothetical protein